MLLEKLVSRMLVVYRCHHRSIAETLGTPGNVVDFKYVVTELRGMSSLDTSKATALPLS